MAKPKQKPKQYLPYYLIINEDSGILAIDFYYCHLWVAIEEAQKLPKTDNYVIVKTVPTQRIVQKSIVEPY